MSVFVFLVNQVRFYITLFNFLYYLCERVGQPSGVRSVLCCHHGAPGSHWGILGFRDIQQPLYLLLSLTGSIPSPTPNTHILSVNVNLPLLDRKCLTLENTFLSSDYANFTFFSVFM